MKIYTSYYSKVSKVDTSDFLLLQVSALKPDWFDKPVVEMPSVYPPWKLIQNFKSGFVTEAEYIQTYGRQLKQLGNNVLDDITMLCEMNGKDKCILLCWEAPDKFCHRKPLGEFLNCGVTELTDEDL